MNKRFASQCFLRTQVLTLALASAFSTSLVAHAASVEAPQQLQEITGSNGDTFMEEASPSAAHRQVPRAKANIINGGNQSTGHGASTPFSPGTGPNARANITSPLQSITGAGSNVFMEEVDTPGKEKPRRAYVNLSNVGIQVDPSGSLVPLIDRSNNPVRPLGSQTQVYNEMPVPTINQTYDNPFALPYTVDGQPAAVGTTFVPVTPGTVPFLQRSYNPYNGISTLNPYSARPYPFGYAPLGSGYPGGGYPGYGGYPRYGGNYGYGGNPFALPSPLKSTFTSSSSSSSLSSPVLRDPATSTGDLLEDAKRSGLWSNMSGSGSGYSNRGIFGGSSASNEEQHQTNDTYGSGLK